MKNMKQWRLCRKALVFWAQMAVLGVLTVSIWVLPGMIAQCRSAAEVFIMLFVLGSMLTCAGVAACAAMAYDNETDRQWREYKRMMSRVRGCK